MIHFCETVKGADVLIGLQEKQSTYTVTQFLATFFLNVSNILSVVNREKATYLFPVQNFLDNF